MWLAMPTWVLTSPAVVTVRIPEIQVSGSSPCGTGSQRYWPRLMTPGRTFGADFQCGTSMGAKRPTCWTEGRMR